MMALGIQGSSLLHIGMKTTLIITFLTLVLHAQLSSAENELVIKPGGIAVETGKTVTLTCKHLPHNAAADLKLDWFKPGGNVPISQLAQNQTVINSSDSDIFRFSSENGTLKIVNTSLEDAGTYTCRSIEDKLQVDAVVKVYNMPSYLTEAMIVIVINIVLIMIFVACSVWTFVRDRKARRARLQEYRKHKLGHKKLDM